MNGSTLIRHKFNTVPFSQNEDEKCGFHSAVLSTTLALGNHKNVSVEIEAQKTVKMWRSKLDSILESHFGIISESGCKNINTIISSTFVKVSRTNIVTVLNSYFLASVCICSASSLVGARMSPTGPSPGASSGWSMMCRSKGHRNAAVFPLPVLAIPGTQSEKN